MICLITFLCINYNTKTYPCKEISIFFLRYHSDLSDFLSLYNTGQTSSILYNSVKKPRVSNISKHSCKFPSTNQSTHSACHSYKMPMKLLNKDFSNVPTEYSTRAIIENRTRLILTFDIIHAYISRFIF